MKKFKGVLNGVESLLSLFSKRRLGAIDPAFGVVEYWSNGVMQKQRKPYISSLFSILQHSSTPTLKRVPATEVWLHQSVTV